MFKFVAIATLLLATVCQASPDLYAAAPAAVYAAAGPAIAVAHAPAITSYSYETRQVHPGPAIAVHTAPLVHSAPVLHTTGRLLSAPLVSHVAPAAPLLAAAPVHYAASGPLLAPYGLSAPLAKTLLIKK
ncbi:cuticle protein 12.5-like [Oppia nitens]|uniref:cuticle protein 12.5-like n=1 Tax=Oppia nitens TaxID=1686743 RepID=UPI0023DA74ED|nr:cuticle protein 12.5-like [Oppia nitens]